MLKRISLVVATLSLALNLASLAQSPDDYFPLLKGNSWVYKGTVKWFQKNEKSGQNETVTKPITWKMEVVDTAKCPYVFAALLKGFPSDLAWYEPGKQRGDHLILRVGTGQYHHLDGQAALEVFKKIRRSQNETLSDIVDENSILLDVPLIDGKIFGEFAKTTSAWYCWVVEGSAKFNANKIKGAPAAQNRRAFTLAFHTNPSHTIFEFVPGLGIVSYQSAHHGTPAECDLHLVECKLGKPAGRN